MSTPAPFRGDAEERTSSGVADDALYAAGNVTSCESDVEFTATDADALHASAAVVVAEDAHDPNADEAVDEDQHTHDEHPGVSSADAEQQQPPRHRSLAQSADTAHDSPGERVRHEPVCSAQPEQLRDTETSLQHAPPEHQPEVQDELAEHEAPGGRQRAIEVMARIRLFV